jgi:hypothetical protein
MTALQRLACLIGLAAPLALSTSSCSDPYTYFNVDVKLDQSVDAVRTARQIASCIVYVLADGKQIEAGHDLDTIQGPAACKAPDTPVYPNDIGTMDYSTIRSSGTIEFVVNMEDTTGAIIVQGSAQGGVKPSQIIQLELVGEPCGGTGSACPVDTSTLK